MAPPIAITPIPTHDATYGIRSINGKTPVENHTINIEARYVIGAKNNPTKIVHIPNVANNT